MRLSTLVLAIGVALSTPALAETNTQTKEAKVAGEVKQDKQGENPFFAASQLPFQAPRFDVISESDYAPAIAAGIQQKLAEVEKIANNPAEPTFDNTFVALEKVAPC